MPRPSLGVLLLLVAFALAPSGAYAQAGVDVRSNTAASQFPDGISFTVEAESAADFDEVRLVYRVAPDGVRATAEADCSGATNVTCTFLLEASRRNVLIPGADVTWAWRFTVDGVEQETEQQVVTYEDDRFDWRSMSDGQITVWWYDGSEDDANAVLAAARETLDDIGALVRTDVDFPVKVWYYATARDMQPAIISDSDEGVVTLGEVVYSDTAMVAADAMPLDITRHEIAHIVIRQAVGAFRIPDWLDEGTAVFAQSRPLSNQQRALEEAIASGEVMSVRSLSSASAGALAGDVSLYYGQSWSLVEFLIDTHGEEKFAGLFQAFREGANDDEALMQVYGFDQDGLENAWRESVGLPPREVPDQDGREVAPGEELPRDEPLRDSTGADGAPVVLIGAIAALTLFLAGGFVILGVALARRYR